MADYYAQTSVLIPYTSWNERGWLNVALGLATGKLCQNCTRTTTNCGCEGGFHRPDNNANFEYEDYDDPTPMNKSAFWVHADECFNGEALVNIVAAYQLEFNRQDFWEMHAAYTCSEPLLDGYGGYGVLVYKGHAYWANPSNKIAELATKLGNVDDFQQTLPVHL